MGCEAAPQEAGTKKSNARQGFAAHALGGVGCLLLLPIQESSNGKNEKCAWTDNYRYETLTSPTSQLVLLIDRVIVASVQWY